MFRHAALATLCLCSTASAAVIGIEISERSDVLGGKSFGSSGRYERVVGTVRFAVDPNLAANRAIVDLARAPRNRDGLVEFSADLYVLKPVDSSKGNGTVLLEVVNRGRKLMLNSFNLAGSNDPRTAADFGDALLLEQGFTLVWVGWQFDLPKGSELMRIEVPSASGVTGIVRSEFIPVRRTNRMPLGDRGFLAYPQAKPDEATLSILDAGRLRPIPRSQWRLASSQEIEMETGFEPGKVYEALYTSKDPPIVGLGLAAVRDIISFLKYERQSTIPLSDQSRFLKRAIGQGASQSGRFLRTFLYDGFNADEKGRKVFDGVWAHVAGGSRGSFNIRFGQPSRSGDPMGLQYPTRLFPFIDLEQRDDEIGITSGLLVRSSRDKVVPKIFYTHTSWEYWGSAASLTHTSHDGQSDAPLARDTRIYFFAGTQHGSGVFPPVQGDGQHTLNPNDQRYLMRALLVALNEWIATGKEPPPSRYPRLDKNQLTTEGGLRKESGLAFPRVFQPLRADYGEQFRSAGIISMEPPKVGRPYTTLVPQVDADGNELGGIRSPEVEVALGSYTGWNPRHPKAGAPGELLLMMGSWFPFSAQKIASRYPGRRHYLDRIRAAAQSLVRDRLMLEVDVAKAIERGAAQWDYLAGKSAP